MIYLFLVAFMFFLFGCLCIDYWIIQILSIFLMYISYVVYDSQAFSLICELSFTFWWYLLKQKLLNFSEIESFCHLSLCSYLCIPSESFIAFILYLVPKPIWNEFGELLEWKDSVLFFWEKKRWFLSCTSSRCWKNFNGREMFKILHSLGMFVGNQLIVRIKAYYLNLNLIPLMCMPVWIYAKTTLLITVLMQ